jgi:hypothetical protein
MPIDKRILEEYIVTANSGEYASFDEINLKFPELKDYDPTLLQEYVATANSGKYSTLDDVNKKFPEFFGEVKKKEQTMPFDGQKFGGKNEEPLLPLTSSTVSPSASKQPKSTTPLESIGGKLPKEEVQIEKPISTQAIDNRDLALTVESRAQRKDYLGKVSEGILSSIKQNPELYLSQKDKPTMYGEKVIPAGTPNVDNISKAVDLYAEKIKKETGRELTTFDKNAVLQSTLRSIKPESQVRNAAMLTNLQFQDKKKIPLTAITGIKTVKGDVVKEGMFKEGLQKIEQEEINRLEKIAKTPDKQLDAEFKPEIGGFKAEVENAANLLKQESQDFFASQFEQTQQQIYNQYNELVQSGQMSADVANAEMKQKLDEYQVQLERDTNAIYEPKLNELKKGVEAKQKDIQTRYNRRVKARFDSEKEKASKRIKEEISKYENALPKGYMEEYQAAFKKNLDSEMNLEGLRKINEFSNLGNFEKMQTAIMAGMGDVASTIGGSLSYVGVNTGNLQNWVAQSGLYNELPVFNDDNIFENLTNTDWWIANGVRSIPFTVATMPIGVAGGTGAGLLASALGAGKRAQVIASVVGGGFAGWEVERFLEQGAGFNEAINEGKSVSEAAEIAAAIGKYNYSTLPMNMLQMLPVFSKSFKFLGSAGIEAGAGAFEEINQGWAQAKAKAQSEGQDVSYLDYATSPQAIQEGAIGSAMSQGFTLFSLKNTPEVDKQINTLMTSIGIGGESQALEVLKTMRNNGAIDEKQFEEATNLLNYTLNAISQTENINVDDNVKSALVNRFVAIEKAKELLTENENDLASQAAKELIADKETEIKNILKGSEPVYLIKITGNDIPVVSTKEEVESILNNKLILPLLEIEVYNDNKTKASVESVYAKKTATEIKTDESGISQEAAPKGDTGVEVTEPVIEEGKEQVEIEETPIKEQETIAEASDSKGVYLKDGEYGVLRTEGQTVVFETNDKIFDLGNKDELSDVSIAEFGIEKEEPLNIQVNQDNSIVIDDVRFVNNFSEPQAAINTDADGNVISVNLETEDGKKRTFRGQRAEEIAYQYKLKEFEQNATEESIARLEQEVTSIEGKAEKAKSETKKRSAAKRKSETIKTKEDAVQEQTAGQVPVQPKAKDSSGDIGSRADDSRAEKSDISADSNKKQPSKKVDSTEEAVSEEIGSGLLNFLGIPLEVESKDAGVNVSNKSALAELEGKVKGDKKSIIEAAKKAIATLKSVFPDMEIYIHETPESYNKVMRDEVGGVENSSGNFAFETDSNNKPTGKGRVDINLSVANNRTVAHEVSHGIMLKAFGDNPALFKNFRDKISKVITESSNKALMDFANQYVDKQGKLLDVTYEEYLAELTGVLAAQQNKISPTTLQRIAALINELVSKITNGKLKPFENTKDTKEIIEFFSNISKAIREGGVIEGVTEKINTSAKSTGVKIDTSSLKSKSSLIQDLGLQRFSDMSKRIAEGVTIKDLGNVESHLTFSDRLVTGKVGSKDYLGGILFAAATNRVWASFTKTRVSQIISGMPKNKDGYRYLMPALLTDIAHMSNKDMSNTAIRLVEDAIAKGEISPLEANERITKALSRKGLEKFFELYSDTIGKNKITPEIIISAIDNALVKSSTTFDDRNTFLETLLGKADIDLSKRFGTLPSYNVLANGLAEPITNGHDFGDILLVIRTKGDLIAVQPKEGDADYHPSYPWVIRSVNPDGSIAEVETLIFKESYSAIDVFPEVTNKQGQKYTYQQYVDKYGDGAKSRYLGYMGARSTMSTSVTEKIVSKAKPKSTIASKAQVDVYHGSPYDFDKFTTEKIGTGEGAQAFGWGLYFTDLESIAKNYAEKLSRKRSGFYYYVNNDGEYTFVDLNNVKHESYILASDKNPEQAFDEFIKRDYSENSTLAKFKKYTGSPKSIASKMLGMKESAMFLEGSEKEVFANKGKRLYKVTLHEGKSPSEYTWLEWDKPLNINLLSKIKNNFKANRDNFKKTENYNQSDKYLREYYDGLLKKIEAVKITSNSDLYKRLSVLFGSDKQASLFLLEIGIDGVKYPAESISRGATSDTARGFNYVVFDENAVTIKSKAQKALDNKIKEYIDSQRKAGQTDKNIRAGIEMVADRLGLSALDIDNLMNAEKIENSKKAFEFWLNLGSKNEQYIVSAKMKSEAAKAGIDEKALKSAAKTMKNITEIREKLLDAKVIETIDCKWG